MTFLGKKAGELAAGYYRGLFNLSKEHRLFATTELKDLWELKQDSNIAVRLVISLNNNSFIIRIHLAT